MKYILLASASAFAFAGAAAAEVTFSGEAELGYNDHTDGDYYGFYWSASLGLTLTQELNNGLTAGASFGIDLADDDWDAGVLGQDLDSADYVLWLESENAALYFGTTDPAAIKHWAGVDGMAADRFTEDAGDGGYMNADTPPVWEDGKAAVLRGDVFYGGIDASVSYLVDMENTSGDLDQLSVGASGSFGNFNFSLAYQDYSDIWWPAGDFYDDRVFGVSVGTTFGGADVTLAYAKTTMWAPLHNGPSFDSIGIQGSYPIGPVTVGAYYVSQEVNPVSDGNTWGITADYASGPVSVSVYAEGYERTGADTDWGIDASYDVGNGLTVGAGYTDAGDDYYVAGVFDLGSGAALGLSYAVDDAGDSGDEIGGPEYQRGTTAWISFTF